MKFAINKISILEQQNSQLLEQKTEIEQTFSEREKEKEAQKQQNNQVSEKISLLKESIKSLEQQKDDSNKTKNEFNSSN